MNYPLAYIGGDYKVLQRFGGAMGHVFLVEKLGIPYPFVLKSFHSTKPEFENRFLIEAKNWVSFGVHQNIVKALFADRIDGNFMLLLSMLKEMKMELIDLPTISGRICNWLY